MNSFLLLADQSTSSHHSCVLLAVVADRQFDVRGVALPALPVRPQLPGCFWKSSPGNSRPAALVSRGAAFVWPVIQDYSYLSLTPMPIDIQLRGALSKQNIRVNTPSTFTVGISTEPGVMENAAERLLGQT